MAGAAMLPPGHGGPEWLSIGHPVR